MLVFDDRAGDTEPRQAFDQMRTRLREAATHPLAIVRHAVLVAQLVAGGGLVQGLADAAFERSGREERTPIERAGMQLPCRIARAVRKFWDSGFPPYTPLPDELVSGLLRRALPKRVRTKQAEGFTFYALYPESYLEAARAAKFDIPAPGGGNPQYRGAARGRGGGRLALARAHDAATDHGRRDADRQGVSGRDGRAAPKAGSIPGNGSRPGAVRS